MKYTIITENDISEWKDKTGEIYHFPKRYINHLKPGTKLIYYKGKQIDKRYKNLRLSEKPHYFGLATIEKVYKDDKSVKGDYYAELRDFLPFSKPVHTMLNEEYLEQIPINKVSNYWRDGVRPINEAVYNSILKSSDITTAGDSEFSDLYQGLEESFESNLIEGKKKQRFTSYYERRPEYRQQALLIHGYTCMGCALNFEEKYGDIGKGFIHVHHVKPISKAGETIINPLLDLIVLCANCHSMVHRQRNKTLTLVELKSIIRK